MLTFPIKRRWFDMIRSGEKKEEYRDKTSYYDARLGDCIGREIEVLFRNGYARTSPTVKATVTVSIGTGRAEWGAVCGAEYYVLGIRTVEDVEPEVFVLEARKCKRCGGILTSAKAVRNGYGHICLMRTKAEEEFKKNQISMFEK